MSIFFTSDSHFGHVNCVIYCKRPFLIDPSLGYVPDNVDIKAMDEALIDNWNRVVAPTDHTYHLGDVAMGPNLKERVTAIRKRLNGTITLILGNHDRSRSFHLACGFDQVERVWQGEIEGNRVHMRHHPPERPTLDNGVFDLLLCGHVHERWKSKGKLINVGVDQHNFTPVSFDSLLKIANINAV